MRNASQKSPEQQRLDALWRAYINSDPDLRRFYRHKRKIEERRLRQAYIRLFESTHPTWLPNPAQQLVAMAALSFVSVALLGALLICL